MNNMEDFSNIRPYNDVEVAAAMQRLARARQLRPVMAFLYPDKSIEEIIAFIKNLKSTDEFQDQMVIPSFREILKLTTNGMIVSGFENFNGKPCLFVSNHRDISHDATIFNDNLLKMV
jgi:hypothetical protein